LPPQSEPRLMKKRSDLGRLRIPGRCIRGEACHAGLGKHLESPTRRDSAASDSTGPSNSSRAPPPASRPTGPGARGMRQGEPGRRRRASTFKFIFKQRSRRENQLTWRFLRYPRPRDGAYRRWATLDKADLGRVLIVAKRAVRPASVWQCRGWGHAKPNIADRNVSRL